MNSGDEFCNLGCVKNPPIVHEFVGPVKIVLVDPTPIYYYRRAWGSAFVAFGNLLMAGVVTTMVLFTLYFGLPLHINAHIASCSVGFQLLLPSGILMLNPSFGPTIHLKRTHRKYQHIFFQHISIAFGVGGAVFVMLCAPLTFNIHTISGMVSMVTVMITVLIGPLVFFFDPVKWPCIKKVRQFLKIMGIFTFTTSSVCFCTGCIKPSFKKWCKELDLIELPLLMCVLCALYTVIFTVAIRWRSKIDA